jgi:hypothetical protein
MGNIAILEDNVSGLSSAQASGQAPGGSTTMGIHHQRGLHVAMWGASSVLLPLYAALLLRMSFPWVATSIVALFIAYMYIANVYILYMPSKAFEYLEQCLTGACSVNYSCEHFYEVCRLLQVFDPALAMEVGCDVNWVALMHATIKGFGEHIDLNSLIAQLPAYDIVACCNF